MKVHFIQHETFEAPGAYLEWAEQRNHLVSVSRVYNFDALPHTAKNIDLLIVMGGPQSPDSDEKDYPYFNAKVEIELIKKCIDDGKAVVGVCLGAQLIGEALEAKTEHSPEKEIGVFPIQLTDEGIKNGMTADFGSLLPVGHWHNDMPGLTTDSEILAFSTGCPRQIIAYSNLVYGFQCHMELNSEVVELLIASDEDLLNNSSQYKFVQSPEEIRNFDFTEMNHKLFQFLDKLIEEYDNTQKSLKFPF